MRQRCLKSSTAKRPSTEKREQALLQLGAIFMVGLPLLGRYTYVSVWRAVLDCAAQQLSLGKRVNCVTLRASGTGACMSVLETVILTLVMVWTPALAFVAYLLIPRSTD
jgi:hypothetical protein